jgi:CheY-like chemotaxis protein
LQLLPIIAVTASSQENDEQNLRDRFNGYLRKPFSQRTLYKEFEKFLPRRGQSDPAPQETGGIPRFATVATAKRAPDWELLLAELRTLQAGEWVSLRDCLAINETLAFARKLRLLATHAQCSPLVAYADTLTGHAEAYAVRDLEEQLAAFPGIVQSIGGQTEPNCG